MHIDLVPWHEAPRLMDDPNFPPDIRAAVLAEQHESEINAQQSQETKDSLLSA